MHSCPCVMHSSCLSFCPLVSLYIKVLPSHVFPSPGIDVVMLVSFGHSFSLEGLLDPRVFLPLALNKPVLFCLDSCSRVPSPCIVTTHRQRSWRRNSRKITSVAGYIWRPERNFSHDFMELPWMYVNDGETANYRRVPLCLSQVDFSAVQFQTSLLTSACRWHRLSLHNMWS